jgi:pimeloyl-ACP methyl ester carboxylesterase
MNKQRVFFLAILVWITGVRADGLADNRPEKVRPVPPPGIAIPEADRMELTAAVAELGKEIESLRAEVKSNPAMLELLTDVQIFHNAVRYALTYNEFYKTNQTQIARDFIKQGHERAQSLREGRSPWTTATGLIVRGYLSKIDGSVQPYGLVVPPTYQAGLGRAHRLDLWFHGRGETLTELDFINGRQKSPGEFTPHDAFVLHLYGRYCNGNKFAGEVDVFEALDNVRKHYPIDENRLVVRGFSLGGAACWHLAVHYAGLWAAAAPGAGFSETPEFLKVFQKETLAPSWYEKKLWHLYDSTDYAVNLFNCPTVAYSGESDSQKQAADIMGKALAEEGIELVHIIGPKTGHSYHPDAKREINRRIDSIAARGRKPVPHHVRFTTWTLRYNQMNWVTVDGLEQHWERARVDAVLDIDANSVRATTKNVSVLTLDFAPGLCPLDNTRAPAVVLDGRLMTASRVLSDRSWRAHFRKNGKLWETVASSDDGILSKRHGLQGPIDDAFMDAFIMVRPTGRPMNEKVGARAAAEMARAIEQWKLQFRGEPRVKDDTEITDVDMASSNLVLWGDPASNQLLARLADKLPIKWRASELRVGSQTYAIDHHVPVLIYPNPLNPKRYVVLNSGFTFREYDQLNNARQVPKLPDFAIVDVNVPVSSRAPGGIADAGFFGEHWELTKATKMNPTK